MARQRQYSAEGEASYREWRDELRADPEYQKIYAEEAAKSELWLQLVATRQAAGLTQKQVAERMGVSQAQVARIEKRGYDAYTLRSLRRYIEALGDEFSLQVTVRKSEDAFDPPVVAGV
jgi:predicted XRE-type DNA-binding protein